jgi:penicillin-binding protein 2
MSKQYFSSATEFKLEKSFRSRLYLFAFLILISFSVFFAQLFNLQILHGADNSLRAEKFVRRSESLPATRGMVYDRNFISPEASRPLVYNSDSLDVVLNSSALKHDKTQIKKFIQSFASALSIPPDYYKDTLSEPKFSKKVKSRKTILLLRDITKKQHERIASFNNIFQYVILLPSPRRVYQLGKSMAHITGYVGKPNQRELKNPEVKSYQLVGKDGLERQYDSFLRGSDGFRIRKKNSMGSVEDERVIEDAKTGNNLVLTIDRTLQLAAFKALRKYRGTVIVVKPATGEVLALVSNPTYDPNILSGKNKRERSSHYGNILKYGGFLNIALQSKFPPASTFKTVVALAALESEHRISFEPSHTFSCNGTFILKSSMANVSDQEFKCWDKRGHGTLNLTKAIEKSCSVYFYNLGYKLGGEPILTYSRLFGLDKKTYIDLPGEIEGFIPSNDWKKRTYGDKWFDGDTINLSIGQGFLSVTPMGMMTFYMAIANNGKIYQPYILSEIRDPVTNTVIHKTLPKLMREVPLKLSTITALKKSLRGVAQTGTASGILNLPDLPEIAGKTGTAQTRRRGLSSSNHAWFVGYAPYNEPVENQIMVAVFVEYGVGGSVGAAPVAREVFKAAFPVGSYEKSQRTEPSIIENVQPPVTTDEENEP